MSYSCLSSGGGRAYLVEALDLEVIKSPCSTSWISNSSSPSSTLSESSNCALTRKPRTPRKRPNQTYNEAAAILSTAYPKIFPTTKLTNNIDTTNAFMLEPSELLMPFQEVDSLLDSRLLLFEKPDFPKGLINPCGSPAEMDSSEFDAESILDEEMGEGIESIMGNLQTENEQTQEPIDSSFCYGYPVGYGMRRESRAMRNLEQCDWWSFPSVNMIDVCSESKKKKKVEEMETKNSSESGSSQNQTNAGLLLKLNYDAVLRAWSDKDSPFPGDSPASDSAGNDVRARLAQIDLFWDNGGVREASVLRYKEKRRTRLFSKKIRYEVRKVNADRRPRMKGRFVRTPNSSDD